MVAVMVMATAWRILSLRYLLCLVRLRLVVRLAWDRELRVVCVEVGRDLERGQVGLQERGICRVMRIRIWVERLARMGMLRLDWMTSRE